MAIDPEKSKGTQFRSGAEAVEKGRKGGKASGEARRKKKTFAEALKYILYDAELSAALKERLKAEGIEEKTHQMVVARSMVAEAEKGNVQAYVAIRDSVGEKPIDKTQLSGGLDTNIQIGFVETGVDPVGSEEDIDV